jgi:hypothetical protein
VNLPSDLTLQLYTGPLAWLGASQAKGDSNADNIVDALDLLNLRKSWQKGTGDPHGTDTGQYNCACDFNHDGIVDALDLLTLRQNWQQSGWGVCASNCP